MQSPPTRKPDRQEDCTSNVPIASSSIGKRGYTSSSRRAAFTKRLSVQMGEKSLRRDDRAPRYSELKQKLAFLCEVILGYDLLVVFVLSSVLTLIIHFLSDEKSWISFLSQSKAAIGTLGAFYSFALVFRTNICYSRWWEGRTLWGTMIVNCIRITQQARLWIEDELLVDRLECLAITFAYACKAQLREKSIDDEEEHGSKLVACGILAQEELNVISRHVAWQPYYCIDAMRSVIYEGLKTSNNQSDWRKNVALEAMERTICTLSDAIGGCIRVRSTGLPVAYDDILYTMGAVFFTAACMAWAGDCGPYNPLLVLVIYIAVKMIIGVGNDMEDPFGHDVSDLPLEKFCTTIERQIEAIGQRADMAGYNLAYGPSVGKMGFPGSSSSSCTTLAPISDDDDIEVGPILETDAFIDKSSEEEQEESNPTSYQTFP
uniref:Bestrophin homolog n=1 Tax=Pseudictyota dubia TaxID=2749911 RepID=A0A7R9ZD09_9STRA|mmetsp:Transcript_4318/g.7551  ORF Transcript_4318/g.7551 Transcript_4318/m.7551 type:complete len:432 (+) Transcript_4318:106-1401(+)|eukprot:CAMPEP_0197440492 /NCGR_PEP_ID=MMETSP1175-20131217/6988_1 /TAXON_ID=1003142 /ORGANISM="Triceratium dubium, Strain CCMP147" /LENGTH=431 /DNA_ID=CAMNT_0042970607 /DNA_START=81 /DNA_END=1373 /DNA_ORIENTATION=+